MNTNIFLVKIKFFLRLPIGHTFLRSYFIKKYELSLINEYKGYFQKKKGIPMEDLILQLEKIIFKRRIFKTNDYIDQLFVNIYELLYEVK